MLHEQGPDLFSFVYTKALQTPRDSLAFRCLHFENCLLTSSFISSWICVFLFSASSSTVKKKLLLGTVYLKKKKKSIKNWKKCKKKMHILINIHMASHLLHNKLAQKVSFHWCIHIEKESLCLCLLSVYSLLMFLAFIFIPYLKKNTFYSRCIKVDPFSVNLCMFILLFYLSLKDAESLSFGKFEILILNLKISQEQNHS